MITNTLNLNKTLDDEKIDKSIKDNNPSPKVKINVYTVFSKYSKDDASGSKRKPIKVYFSYSETKVTILINMLMNIMNNHREGITNWGIILL